MMRQQSVFSYWSDANHQIHAELLRDWRAEFPTFTIFGDDEVLPLLMRYFPRHVDLYEHIRIPTAKADIALLLLLYERGGLYVDCHCGIRDANEIRALFELLDDYDAIFVDRTLAQEPRPIEEHLLINSVIFCRPRLEMIFRACRQALLNLARQRRVEHRDGFVPYDVWSLSGPWVLTTTVLEPASYYREVRWEYVGRIQIIREEITPIVRSRYRGYSRPGQHWSERQKVELLFAKENKASPVELLPEDLTHALATSERPDLLQRMIDTSRRAFGVHMRHYPHTINYPWTASRLEGIPTGSRILDVGAGASPLPLYLAETGMYVECVDNSDIQRTLPPGDDWNEWGFFDYGTLHPNLTAHNSAIENFKPWHRYDAIYSVSAIAHFPSSIRDRALRNCWAWLKPRGRLVLAVDLIPKTDTLWNLGGSEETPEQHGTYGDMEQELRTLGFSIAESRILRRVDNWSRTDLYFLVANKGDDVPRG
jgi:SAM-dependent methyltransferase